MKINKDKKVKGKIKKFIKHNKLLTMLIALGVIEVFTLFNGYSSDKETGITIDVEEDSDYITYIVVEGDTLTKIAEEYGTTVESIKELNSLKSDDIYPGNKLKISKENNKEEKQEEKKETKEKEENATKEKKKEKQEEKKEKETKAKDETSENKSIYKGIDVSKHQKNINWKQVKNAGIDFAIIRIYDAWHMSYEKDPETGELIGKLSTLDDNFEQNVKGCEENDIPYGIYHFSRATTERQAEIEAHKFLKFAAKYNIRPTYPVYYDIESLANEPLKNENNESVNSVNFINKYPNQVLKNFKAFAKILEDNGYYCGIYTSDEVLKKIDPTGNELKDYAIWNARYAYDNTRQGFEAPKSEIMRLEYQGNSGIHQFSKTGKVDGIKTNVDCNYCKINYDKVIREVGLNKPLKDNQLNKIKGFF